MPQRVEYESLPGTRFDQYVFKLKMVLSSLQAGNTKFKAFRDFLRKQNLWDKDRSEVLFSLIDVSWDKRDVKIGKVAKRLMNASSDADFQQILFDHLRDQNILLVKYVLEALDVESGGRLHSVHELYRMITSYVYPGARITLTNFQAWMDWLAASGFIKLVGIRWALSDKGLKVVGELKAMDVEEILEDMEDEDEEEGDDDADDDDDGDDDDDAPAPRGRTPDDELDDEEDLFADLPPEPEPPSEADIAAAQDAFSSSFDDVPGTSDALTAAPKAAAKRRPQLAAVPAPARIGAPSTTAPAAATALHLPVAAREWPAVATVSLDDPDTAALASRITGWYQALSGWPIFDAPSLGVAVDPAGSELALLVELGTLATLVEGLPAQPAVFAFVRRLRQTTFFASLGYGEGLEECLDALERTGDEPWGRALFERIVHSRFVARRASMKLDLMPSLRAAADGAAFVALLREHLLGQHWVEAPFWVARELVRLGAVDTDAARSVACVPTRRLRENAARIGLVPRAEIHDFQSLLALSQQVGKLFGAEAGYGVALEQLDFALGLTV